VEIDGEQRARIHGWIARYDPPESMLVQLADWAATEDGVVLPDAPGDPQLDAACALLRGEHPAPARRRGRGD
ncbi:hypothetical protein OAF93_02180, partial [Planctomycetota bacterium]|nr:hypothetical protein [Planctomycetota bacterium]